MDEKMKANGPMGEPKLFVFMGMFSASPGMAK
jgi:hypothetical protein